MQNWSDKEIEEEIDRVQKSIEDWATSKELWFDSGFSSYLDHVGGEPSSPPAAILYHRLSGLLCHRPLQVGGYFKRGSLESLYLRAFLNMGANYMPKHIKS
jgi:hypothetical protein